MNKKHIILSIAIAVFSLNLSAQDNGINNLRQYFAQYTNPLYPNLGKITVEDIQTDAGAKHMTIVLSDNFFA